MFFLFGSLPNSSKVPDNSAIGAWALSAADSLLNRLGEEMVTYGDLEELYYLVNYYLQHEEERKEIAARGLQRVKDDFRFEERMKVILEDL